MHLSPTMCRLIIPNTSSTIFMKSFLTLLALTHFWSSIQIISIATLFEELTIAIWPVSLHTFFIFFSTSLWVYITLSIPQIMNLRLGAIITQSQPYKLAWDLYWLLWFTIIQDPQLDSKGFEDREHALFFHIPLVLNTVLNT